MRNVICKILLVILCVLYTHDSYAQWWRDRDWWRNYIFFRPIQDLNFGMIAKPNSGQVKVVVNTNGSLGGATSAIMLNTSSISAGSQNVRGSPRRSVGIQFSECSSNAAMGLKIENFRASFRGNRFTNSAVGLGAPGFRGTTLRYGATLVVQPNANTGLLKPCYNIDVNYD